jgi:hypothetical protein
MITAIRKLTPLNTPIRITQIEIHWTMLGFVDDSNGQVNNFHKPESTTAWRTL